MPLELSLFLDESGSDALDSKYYLLVVVMHEQSCDLMGNCLCRRDMGRRNG